MLAGNLDNCTWKAWDTIILQILLITLPSHHYEQRLFSNYTNMFLQMKTQASGYPSMKQHVKKRMNILHNMKNTKEYVWILIK